MRICAAVRPSLICLAARYSALGSLDQVEVADVDTLLFGEAQRGTRRRADGVVGDGLGRAGDFVSTSVA